MATAESSVLVLGANAALTWSVARCLRRAGWTPSVLSWPGLQRGSQPRDTPVLAQVRQLCERHHFNQVLAADYDTSLLLAPPAATVITLHDPWKLSCTLAALKLPAPDSMRANDATALLANTLVYPIVTRPLDRCTPARHKLYRSRVALERALAHGRLASSFPLLAQSQVSGWEVGASFLARAGRLQAWSVFRHTGRAERRFYASVRVRDYLERFVGACAYNGAGQLDLRYDPVRDSYFILALHPHFTASLLYAEHAGLNYPDLLLRLDDAAPSHIAVPRPGRVRLSRYERIRLWGAS